METLELLDQKFDLSKTKSFVLKGNDIKTVHVWIVSLELTLCEIVSRQKYPKKVALLAARVLLAIAIELVIISCRKILILIINALPTLLVGFLYH